MEAERLRRAFTEFFLERGHELLAPASLVPNDPTVLFTIAGMVQFKPYFLGEAVPAAPRATTIQPCLRTTDIDLVGTTARHCTFFEMLGNFSFGDYFKDKAIPWAWEFVTEVLGFDPDRLWATVHTSDDEAAEIWPSSTSLPGERVQRLDDDNFWKMGDTGPCGPSSEIFFDRGEQFGPGGGPGHPAADTSGRYTEIWNLVFMQFDRSASGDLTALPSRNIDTGAGLDRLLTVLQDVPDVQAIDCVAPIVERAAELTGQRVGADERSDTGLRIIGDHARAFTFAIGDGVFPSNEGRGYVLRRLIRRAVLRAHQLGRKELLTAELVDAVVATMASAYPTLATDVERIKKVVVHEEEAFLRTLRQGTALLEDELAKGRGGIGGDIAFRLHDTFGFPFELTKEIAAERGIVVDEQGYENSMAAQRQRAREATRAGAVTPEELAAEWRTIRTASGPTQFLGYEQVAADATVLATLPSAVDRELVATKDESRGEGFELLELFLDRTPFYAEGGGQVGDTGTITTATGQFRVLDTRAVLEGLTRHIGYVSDGSIETGQEARAGIDSARRDAIRRNHTGTHLLHWALRSVLGDHVRQQGSLVAPDRLRFDFSHFGPLSPKELVEVEALVNERVISDEVVETVESARDEAVAAGAIAFFGDKYGDVVRVVHAGHGSVELCGGTHVNALGMIGPMRIVSEASIGANTRRIEAVTGAVSLARIREMDRTLQGAAELLRTKPEDVAEVLSRLVTRHRNLEEELRQLRAGEMGAVADQLARSAADGVVVARRDGLGMSELRELALSIRDRSGIMAVALVGAPGDGRVALVVALTTAAGLDARLIVAEVAKLVGGGGGGSPELATAGGRDESRIDDALVLLGQQLSRTR
ncbi:MAG: alanine--tRNA ligase [Acidimicrobiales bacterium]